MHALCALAGRGDLAAGFVAKATPVAQVRRALLEAGAVLGKVTLSGKYKALDPAALNGSQDAAGVLYDAIDASAADTEGVAIVRLAEVNFAELVWPEGITGPEQTTALGELATLNIIAR